MKKKKTEAKVSPAGAVEINEEDLDKAAGGATFTERTTTKSTSTMPTDSISINFLKIEIDS